MSSTLLRGMRMFGAALVVLLGVASIGGLVYFFLPSASGDEVQIIVQRVKTAPFTHIVLEQGEVESSRNVEVSCKVKSRNSNGTAILWVVPEGSFVKKGDKLVELDASALEQERNQQKIVVNTSEALKIAAESALEQAEVARDEYVKGTFVAEKQLIESEILVAEENLSRAREVAKFSERLAAQGFQTELQLKADLFAVEKAKVELELARGKLKTLQEITRRKMLIGFDAEIETARAKAEAEISSHQEELSKLKDLDAQIANCLIYAPEDGQVVHANKYSSRGGNAEFVVEAGSTVRERQAIIRLPDPKHMQVKAKISESRVPLVKEGMDVIIQIGAFEEDVLRGRVIKVNKYAEPSSWWSSQVKKYATLIQILDPPANIRTGMTAEVRILVEQLDNALQVPAQALHGVGDQVFCLVKTPTGKLVTRELKIGSSNDKWVIVKEGVKEGEQVVMNVRKFLPQMDLPEVKPEGAREKGAGPSVAKATPKESKKSRRDGKRGKNRSRSKSGAEE